MTQAHAFRGGEQEQAAQLGVGADLVAPGHARHCQVAAAARPLRRPFEKLRRFGLSPGRQVGSGDDKGFRD